jgi:hypothetical protein
VKIKIPFLALMLLLFAIAAKAQTEKPQNEPDCFKQHSNAFDFYDNLRLLPITVTSIEGKTVFYQFRDAHQIKLVSAVITDKSDLPADFRQKYENKRFFLVYCSKHFTIQIIQAIEKSGKN